MNEDVIKQNPKCKYCNAESGVRCGTYKGVQRYWRKSCQRKFKGGDSLFHSKVKPEYISSAMDIRL